MTMFPIYKLGEISTIYNGNSINAEEKERKYRGVDGRDYIGTKDIDFDCSVNYNNGVKIPCDEMKFKIAPAGSVLVCAEGGSAGKKSAYITKDVCFGNKLFAITNNQNLFEGKYVFYYTRYKQFFDLFKNELSGLIGGVSSKKFGEIPIPLPPLPTQHAIVSRIESLFAELDKAEERLRTAQQQLKIYRQAVLNYWLNNESEKCRKMKLKDICISISDGDHLPPKRTTKGIPFITISDIKGNSVDFSNVNYMTEEYYDNLAPSRKAQKGDILYTVTGSFGIPVLVDNNMKFCFQRHIGILRPDSNLVSQKWLYYMMQSPIIYSQANEKATGTAQKTVTLTVLRDFNLSLPALHEQQRIVKEIESRLSQTEATEARIAESLQQTEALRQSILKKAFSGDLI
ncbi:MAG: restriction endonuclease subunit S [Paludibacteraceae bacterium]|nr:restriction endonuclease subunit S [Paludibacteraceae bacterium]